MLKDLKKTFKKIISSLSFTFLIFPYLVYTYLNTNLNFEILLLIISLLVIDFFISRRLKNFSLLVTISISVLIFFYSKIIFNDTEIILHQLRFREFVILFGCILFSLLFFLLKKNDGIKIINTFLIVFGLSFFLNSNSNKYFNQKYLLDLNAFEFENTINIKSESDSPLIFMLFDELSSSNEIFSYTKNKEDLHFDKQMKDYGFEVISDFKSSSTSTKYSMPSIFNFNLHKRSDLLDSLEKINDNNTIQKSFYWLVSNNLLIDSLNKKGIKSYSYGLFPFKNGIAENDFIYWWPSFSDPLRMFKDSHFFNNLFQNSFLKTIESVFIENTNVDQFRNSVYRKLETLDPKKNNFYYFHFFAPHEPFTWGDEYFTENSFINGKNKPEIELQEHIKYRRFFLNKVLPLIKSEKFKNSKIIIVGDHGFRFNKDEINPSLTNLYLFNYPKGVLSKSEHVVQDLGYLILNSFN